MKTMTLAKYKHVRRTDAGAKGFNGSKSKQADVLGRHEEAEVCNDAEQGTLGQLSCRRDGYGVNLSSTRHVFVR